MTELQWIMLGAFGVAMAVGTAIILGACAISGRISEQERRRGHDA